MSASPPLYASDHTTCMADIDVQHFDCDISEGIATIGLRRPERKNPFTFDSYAELGRWFRQLAQASDVDVVIWASNEGHFSSGGDVHEIIGPLTQMDMPGLLRFTRMTGELVKAMLHCGRPIIAAIDGVCAGAGAIAAMASDLRLGTPQTKVAFLFTRVGLAGCDMGACAILPRLIGQGRTADLLYTGRAMNSDEGLSWGFFNALHDSDSLSEAARTLARRIAQGPNFAHMMTKTQLNHEWNMALEQAIEAEAQAQAICMQTQDFQRAYQAFVNKGAAEFEGN